ncbi:hypothetical protein S40288_04648 [Stachybotrys chartarum IBT 40288]|nr:hypothetical protein S40288_04648 [Stachybotrys chartarum IBT 40288]
MAIHPSIRRRLGRLRRRRRNKELEPSLIQASFISYGNGVGNPKSPAGVVLPRRFDPSLSIMHRALRPPAIFHYDAATHTTLLKLHNPARPLPEVQPRSMVVWISGAARNPGSWRARGAWGMYFGPGSKYNAGGCVEHRFAQTRDRAELDSLTAMLFTLRFTILEELPQKPKKLYIVTDCGKLVRSMTEYMDGWLERKGVTKLGEKVPHWHELISVNNFWEEMEDAAVESEAEEDEQEDDDDDDDDGSEEEDEDEDGEYMLEVDDDPDVRMRPEPAFTMQMWLVSPNENKEAHALAQRALDDDTEPPVGPSVLMKVKDD